MSPAHEAGPLIVRLRECLAQRLIGEGMRALEEHQSALSVLDPTQRDSGVLLGMVAQWVDIGYAGPEYLNQLLSRFGTPARASLPLIDYVYLRMARSMVAMAEEEVAHAIADLEFIRALEGEIGDLELLAIANFWNGRCLRKMGCYDDALTCTAKGRDLALQAGHRRMAAVMQVMESWLAFQKGRLQEAEQILRHAEAELADTDDFVTRGNIQSAYGRIARRQGRYNQALEHFERSIAEYGRRDPHHLHLARSLVNIGSVKRLIAQRLQRAMDEKSERRRKAAGSDGISGEVRARRLEIEELRGEARTRLLEALDIYTRHRNHRGIGNAHINLGLLHLDGGDVECAETHATEAWEQAKEKNDYILMARARTLQCMIENAKFEEQIGERPERHAQLAAEMAHEAVEHARHTQNRRLLARAYVWQGLTWLNEHFSDREAARRCCDQARVLLRTDAQDPEYTWEDLEALQSRVVRAGRIEPLLQEWSDGLVGNKSFQQITEEFAGIIIPKVWEREGRKISRVAAALSISPKKVRRILHAAGVLGSGGKPEAE